ncbi:MAG TPA: C40 family peptidase [Bacteroidales bacterium]|jgi:cell wall-associated NlpC family hydrolase|nr:C40 family peptidase [Bacteroidales bacterium]MDI9574153.1 C40 family peptidase [Bacteroidota bacterium]OQC61050.1 MAG: Gamma-D-glutamyl-L-lysine endopeptidase [Bacteroidetes bacterium ADurb.Bin012]MBP9512463.1 C40 family peptidase [Bacteroidales bacterium]MBP9588000.1 C40 family peptidase [Bacteroidales bacterium]
MENAVCQLSAAPLRVEPLHKAEMISQLLFGEPVEIIERRPPWCLIKSKIDYYEGWVDAQQLEIMPQTPQFNEDNLLICHQLLSSLIHCITGEKQLITFGTMLTAENGKVKVGSSEYYKHDDFMPFFRKTTSNDIINSAKLWLNTPYLWGGKTPLGVDCSGFVQLVFRCNGQKLPRDAYQQAELGIDIDFVSESMPGDLAFFSNDESHISHVGILIDNSRIIHASGKVRIDAFDHQGIYNLSLKTYTHQLRLMKRLL